MSQHTPDDAPDRASHTEDRDERFRLLGSDWEQRLKEARSRRKKALASASAKTAPARHHVEDSIPDVSDEPVQPVGSSAADRLRAGARAAWASVARFRVHLPNGRIAVVFVGAMGFGLGIGLTFGLLIGMGARPLLPTVVVAQNDPVEPFVTSFRTVGVAASQAEAGAAVALEDVQGASFVNAAAAMAPTPQHSDSTISQTVAPVLPAVLIEVAATDVTAVLPSSVRRTERPAALLAPEDWTATDSAYFGPNEFRPEFFVHAPDGVSNQRVQNVVAQLKDAGVEISQVGREGFRVSQTHLRFYSVQTAPAAKAVAEGLGVEARDFSARASSDDRIEIWLSGSPKPVEQADPERSGFFQGFWSQKRDDR